MCTFSFESEFAVEAVAFAAAVACASVECACEEAET